MSKACFKIDLNLLEGFLAINIFLARILGLISQKLFVFTCLQFVKFVS